MYGNSSRERIADAWKQGKAANSGSVSTNGREVYSYAHVVGITTGEGKNGRKVAYSCRYSRTTSKHVSAFKRVADDIVDHCPSCDGRESKIWDRIPPGLEDEQRRMGEAARA